MSSQVSSRSSASSTTNPPPPTHFTPRPKQDPVGMSALFVAVTVVCALGASSILISTRDSGSGIAGAFDSLLTTVTRANTSADPSDKTGSITVASAEPRPQPSLTPALAAALHGSAAAMSDQLARVDDEILSIKSVIADVKKDVSTVKSLVKLSIQPSDDADVATEAAVSAAMAPVKSEIKELAAGLAATRVDVAITKGEVAAVKSSANVLYSSIDQMTATHLRDIDAINRRIGKVEDVISLRADVTASIPTRSLAPLPKRRPSRLAGWTAEETAPGLYLLKGPHGSYEVRDGSDIPGIGPVRLVHTADGKLRILTGKDAMRR
jgi:hypothetical protein